MIELELERFSINCRMLFAFALVFVSLILVRKSKVTCSHAFSWVCHPSYMYFILFVMGRGGGVGIVLFASVVIGQSNYFGFGFTTLN